MGKDVRMADREALAELDRHDWPGNVRELQSVVRYAIVQALGEAITADCLPEYLGQRPAGCLSRSRTIVEATCRSGEAIDSGTATD